MKNRMGSENWKTGKTEIPIPIKIDGFLSLTGLCVLCPLSFTSLSSLVRFFNFFSLIVFRGRGSRVSATCKTVKNWPQNWKTEIPIL